MYFNISTTFPDSFSTFVLFLGEFNFANAHSLGFCLSSDLRVSVKMVVFPFVPKLVAEMCAWVAADAFLPCEFLSIVN